MQSKIEIYHDGPTEDQIINLISPEIKGFTFNPSIFKKLKISNYLDACKKYASLAGNKPISLEVIETQKKRLLIKLKFSQQFLIMSVKVPVMLTTETTYELIENLVNKKIQKT